MRWFIYVASSPIDFGWELLGRHGQASCVWELPFEVLMRVKACGWHGDIRGNDCGTFYMPIDGTMVEAVMWKQDHAGHTFIVSPVALPGYEEQWQSCVKRSEP